MGYSSIDEDFYEELEETLVMGDIGISATTSIIEDLKTKVREQNIKDPGECRRLLIQSIKDQMDLGPGAYEFENRKSVILVVGVNGVGKTTTAAKLAKCFKNNGTENIVLASADTFRAAAIEQLALHGERLGVRVVSHQHGSDPSAVVFDAADAMKAAGPGLVIADTAGRLHNKENLVRELQKIDRTCSLKADEGCYKKILVIDATTGQNALRQAEVFNEAVKIDAIIMTKYDSTAKGGVAVSIGRELGLPVAYVCTGEGYDNIAPFDAEKYIDDFLTLE